MMAFQSWLTWPRLYMAGSGKADSENRVYVVENRESELFGIYIHAETGNNQKKNIHSQSRCGSICIPVIAAPQKHRWLCLLLYAFLRLVLCWKIFMYIICCSPNVHTHTIADQQVHYLDRGWKKKFPQQICLQDIHRFWCNVYMYIHSTHNSFGAL